MASSNRIERTAQEYDNERDLDRFWAVAKPKVEPAKQRWYVPSVLLLVVLSVPWYRETGSMGELVWGLPTWVWTSLGCSLGVAVLTAVGALRYWKDDESE